MQLFLSLVLKVLRIELRPREPVPVQPTSLKYLKMYPLKLITLSKSKPKYGTPLFLNNSTPYPLRYSKFYLCIPKYMFRASVVQSKPIRRMVNLETGLNTVKYKLFICRNCSPLSLFQPIQHNSNYCIDYTYYLK